MGAEAGASGAEVDVAVDDDRGGWREEAAEQCEDGGELALVEAAGLVWGRRLGGGVDPLGSGGGGPPGVKADARSPDGVRAVVDVDRDQEPLVRVEEVCRVEQAGLGVELLAGTVEAEL